MCGGMNPPTASRLYLMPASTPTGAIETAPWSLGGEQTSHASVIKAFSPQSAAGVRIALVADVLSSAETEPCFEKRSSPLPSPPQSVRRSLLPQLLHRPEVAADTAAVAVDTVAVDTAAGWVVDMGWVVVTG